MTKKVEVLQEDKYDCAAASLLSLIRYYGGDMCIEDVRRLINTTKMGTNAYDLISGAKMIGFDGMGEKVSFKELIKEFDTPLIAHIKKNNFYHFIVIYKIDNHKKKLVIMDPSVGLIKMTYEKFASIYEGTVIKLVKTKELPKVEKKNELLKVIIKSILKNKKELSLIIVISSIVIIFSMLASIFYKLLFDNTNYIYKYSFIFIMIIIGKGIFDLIRNIILNNLNKKIELSIIDIMLLRLFHLPYSYHKNKTTGEILSRLNDLMLIKDLILDLFYNSFVNILILISTLIFMAYISIKLVLISLIMFSIYSLITIIYTKHFKKKIRCVQESKGIYNSKLIESIEGLETISNLNVTNIFKKSVYDSYKDNCIETNKYNFCNITIGIFKNSLLDISNVLILMYSALVLKSFSVGNIMLVYVLYTNYISAMKSIIDYLPEFSYAYQNIDKVNGILKEYKTSNNGNLINGDISISGLSYKVSDYIFKGINIVVKEKDKQVLVGKSGCGKSTLLKILLKYFNDYEGAIKVGTVNLKDISDDSIRKSFTYVGQNEKLFNDTLKENILMGRNINEDKYKSVIKITKVDEIINSKSLKENFLIEEDGFNLSGGERQRIILARALLKESNYLFIDEALSEVDYNLEKNIVLNLLKYYKNKTIIYVSHKKEIEKLFNKKIILEKE